MIMSKIRNGFVSNSSSSSFVIISAGDNKIIEELYGDDYEDSITVNIDQIINSLNEAKENGAKTVVIEYGSKYD